jgi:CRISPR-associated endoribonuclease Cas6
VGASDFWHNNGFGDVSRFKGFCFSSLTGRYRVDPENKTIRFEDNIYLEVRSPAFAFIDAFQRALECHPHLKMFDTRLDVTDASLFNVHLPSGRITLRAVTPAVAHMTGEDGATRYFSPQEEEYFARLRGNARRKFEAVAGEPAPEIRLAPAGEYKKTVTKYKGFFVIGYTGAFAVDTTLKMAEFLYNAGLGEKNAQGFGFLQLPPEG